MAAVEDGTRSGAAMLRHWTENDFVPSVAHQFKKADLYDLDVCREFLALCSENMNDRSVGDRHLASRSVLGLVLDAGFRDPVALREFVQFGMGSATAAHLYSAGIEHPSGLIPWVAAGNDISAVAGWRQAGVTDPHLAAEWTKACRGRVADAVDFFSAGFDLNCLPPVAEDRANSQFKEPMAVLARRAGRLGLSELYKRLVRVYACPQYALGAAHEDENLAEKLFELDDRVLRAVLVIAEHRPSGLFHAPDADTFHALIREFS